MSVTLSLATARRVPAVKAEGSRRVSVFEAARVQAQLVSRRAVSAGQRHQANTLAGAVMREAERLALEAADVEEAVPVLAMVGDRRADVLADVLEACEDAVRRYPDSVAARRAVLLLVATADAVGRAARPVAG